jgi:large subunit ribosomal protein L21
MLEEKLKEKLFAIIETGGKQYKVSEGTIIDIEKLDTEAEKSVDFDKILLINDGTATTIGEPYIEKASVSGVVLNHFRDKKKIVFKFKTKTGYQKKQGHRQSITTVKIDKISAA